MDFDELAKKINNSDKPKMHKHKELSDDSLEYSIEHSNTIPDSKKKIYLDMLELFMSDFKNNLFASQFELNTKYDTYSFDQWAGFMNERIISLYCEKHKKTAMKAQAEQQLNDPKSSYKGDSLKMLNNFKDNSENNNNIIVFRIPAVISDES